MSVLFLCRGNSALAKANSGNFNGAIGSMRAFANRVKAFITTHKLTAAQGQPLIDSANALITLLGG